MEVKNWELFHKNIYDLTCIFFILISHLIKFYRSKFCVLGLCVKVLVVGVCRDGLCEEDTGICLHVRNRLPTGAVHVPSLEVFSLI